MTHLFDPLKLGDYELSDRIIMASSARARAVNNIMPNLLTDKSYPKLNKRLEDRSLSAVEHQAMLQTISRYADYYDCLDAHFPVFPINSAAV